MLEKLVKKIAPFALAAGLTLGLSSCPTPVPDPDPIIPFAAEKQAITKAADRLITLQDNDGLGIDGSWDWDVTGKTAPTGISYLNITGVTAEGLLGAYEVTDDAKYLDAAKKAGDYLIGMMGNPVDITKKPNAFNMLFLYHLNEATGEAKYKTQADAMMNNLLHEDNYWAHNDGNHSLDDGIAGCTAEELVKAYSEYRGVANPDEDGLVLWDLHRYVDAAKKAGETAFANDLAARGKGYVDSSGYNPTIPTHSLGLSWINSMKEAGLDYNTAFYKLLAAQNADGSWQDDNGTVQNTAYGIMSLMNTGNRTNAVGGVGLMKTNQLPNGGWLESDGIEYAEQDGEVIRALSDYVTK